MLIIYIIYIICAIVGLICSYYSTKNQGYVTPCDIFLAFIFTFVPILNILFVLFCFYEMGFYEKFFDWFHNKKYFEK